ncbi:hypothetical protein FRX31_011182 [Thalictrum thalictroides]|uniref:Pentatricopeptide repeat-containing protein n=1 Tax=Thalictrum thalictroides TaxID=46969 RepID=A0A7J6WPD0_THATH|nr:hypothetical protein FRX31_011182 [Thalictrum thalictroides]
MLLAGIQPDIVTLNTLINSYSCIGNVDFGFAVFGSILKRGLEPDAVTFTPLLKGVNRRNHPEGALEVLDGNVQTSIDSNETIHFQLVELDGAMLTNVYRVKFGSFSARFLQGVTSKFKLGRKVFC